MARGTLRVYLGAAPGVGKTFAMLDEGRRRAERGADVVVAVVETHGRAGTAAKLAGLEVMPRRRVEHRGAALDEMDLDAVLARRPELALVDELAHTNAPGSAHDKRWQDVDALLDAGIHVITTVNVQHLESLNDVVEDITGVRQRETVPDAVVRRADQIELVDMSPEALRRRMAHGNVYPPERIDAALSHYFRPGNLGALRELALLWAADRVEERLAEYRSAHGISQAWETRERVVVAVTGAEGGDALVRRAARIAARGRGELMGVHVALSDGLSDTGRGATLTRHRDLLRDLGGRYHEVVGDDVAAALVRFARAEHATQLVLGESRRSRRRELVGGSIVNRVLREARGIDVHVIATGADPPPLRLPRAPRWQAVGARRRAAGFALLAVGLPVLTALLTGGRDGLSLATDLLLYLALVVAAGAIGGLAPALVGAVAASLLANWFLVEPFHTFTIGEAENVLALVLFVAVAATVSGFAHLAARRAGTAARARAEAEALARASATLVAAPDPLPALVDHLRATFALDAVAVFQRGGDTTGWTLVASAGDASAGPDGAGATIDLDPAGTSQLAVWGALGSDDRLVLDRVADQLALALDARRNAQAAARTRVLEEADALRASLLQAVSHDLRTPLAGIKASVTSLLAADVAWPEPIRREFLATIDAEADHLDRLVSNLLDLSRLQAGVLALQPGPVAVDELVQGALVGVARPPGGFVVDVDAALPPVAVDPGLAERALANVVANAAEVSPADRPVRIDAAAVGRTIRLRVVDHGPGIPPADRARAVLPFQRLGDGHAGGVGLGLAVADGFVRACGGELVLDDTPGGGLTVEFVLPIAATGEAS